MNFKLKQLLQRPLRRGIFDKISGYENIKWVLEQSIRSEKPVHILLVGPPGVGKTRFLKAIENYFPTKTYFALSSGATGAGMVSCLFERQPRYLLVDEIEDLRKTDQACLMSLMQDQELVETKVSKTRRISLTCSVFATCNNTKKLREPLLSRFKVIQLEEYTKEQFINVAIEQLDVEEKFARYIAESIWNSGNHNMREAERVSNMCRTEEDVKKYLELSK